MRSLRKLRERIDERDERIKCLQAQISQLKRDKTKVARMNRDLANYIRKKMGWKKSFEVK